jgi:hypothetical protein
VCLHPFPLTPEAVLYPLPARSLHLRLLEHPLDTSRPSPFQLSPGACLYRVLPCRTPSFSKPRSLEAAVTTPGNLVSVMIEAYPSNLLANRQTGWLAGKALASLIPRVSLCQTGDGIEGNPLGRGRRLSDGAADGTPSSVAAQR